MGRTEVPRPTRWVHWPNMLASWLGSYRSLHRNARLYLISNVPQAATAGALGVLYTLYLNALGYDTTFIGLVAVVGTIGAGLGILPANSIVARLGWRATLIWSDIIGGIAVTFQLLMPTPAVILVTTLGGGASVALVLVVNTPLLAAFSTPAQRTALYGLSNALAFLATVIGSLLGGALPQFFQSAAVQASALYQTLAPVLVPGATAQAYELALIVTGAIALPSIVPVLLMREERGRAEESSPAGPHGRQLRAWVAPRLSALRDMAFGVIGRFALTQGLVGFGAGIFFPYVNLYFVNQLGMSTPVYGVLSAVLSISVALASLAAAPLARRLGVLRTAISAQIASLPFLVALGAIPVLAVAAMIYLVRGSLMALTSPPLQTYLMDAVPQQQRVNASSAYNVSFQVCWALGAGVGGWLIAVAGYSVPFLVAAPFYALSAALLIRWFGRRRDIGDAEKAGLRSL
jgi:MFS family permease